MIKIYNNIENTNIDCFLYTPIKKEHLYTFSKNEDMLFFTLNYSNFYKSLIDCINVGIIIKITDWDNDILKKVYELSIKLKNIPNFVDYICYFEYEDNFLNYLETVEDINNYKLEDTYVNKTTDEKSIILMKNYDLLNIIDIDIAEIDNIYEQLILALYFAYKCHNIYFNFLNKKFIYLLNNNKKQCKYTINNDTHVLYKNKYLVLICDISNYLVDNNNDINIDLNIITIINNLNLFNDKISNKFYYLVKNKHKIFL
jgi:hypothetical protein